MKKFDFIVHVGTHKTGSSSIQKTLAQLQQVAGYSYLPWGRHATSSLSSHNEMFAQAFPAGNQNISDALREAAQSALVQGIEAVETSGIVISAERISVTSEAELANFREIIAPRARSIRLIAYLRPHVSYTTSALGQAIKQGTELKFPLFVRYENKFAALERVFGRDAITYRPFLRSELVEGDVVTDFSHAMGLPIRPDQVKSSNESLPLEALACAYASRRGLPVTELRDVHKRLARARSYWALKDIGTGKLRLSRARTQEILDRCHADRVWMQGRVGADYSEPPGVEGGLEELDDLLPIAAAQREAVRNAMAQWITRRFPQISHGALSELEAADRGSDNLAAISRMVHLVEKLEYELLMSSRAL